MKNVYLLLILFNFLSFSSLAEEENMVSKTETFVKEKYEDFIAIKDSIAKREEVIKAKEVAEFVFLGKNPIFQDHNHMVSLSYLRSITENDNLNAIVGSYSVPTQIFINGRSSLQIGGFIGDVGYVASPGANVSHPDVSQFFGGIMHEFVLNFNYFYCTAGIGLYIRSANSSNNPGDRIGSRVTFGEKFAIGKSFDRFNIEILYRHFSNGDLTLTNGGYNFIGFEIGFKF